MKRPAIVLLFIITLIAGLTLAQIGVANKMSTTGSELAALQKKIAELQRENSVLQEEILDASSYTNISEKADELGFAPNATHVVLNSAVPLALKQ